MVVRDGSRGAEDPGKAGVAPTASLNGMRRSEKAEVLKGITGYSGAEKPEDFRAHTYIQTHTHHAHNHAASAGVSTAV